MHASKELFDTGTVVAVNPSTYTCDVLTTEGKLWHGVAIMNVMGGPQSTDVSWTVDLRGAVVAITELLGTKYIVGTLPVELPARNAVSTQVTATATGGDNALTYGKPTNLRSMNDSRTGGFLPGDRIIRADGDAEVSVMTENLVEVKASSLAQIILGGIKDFARLIAREIKIFTDFGQIEFSHGSSGRTGMHLRGGADYGSESSPGSPVWTVQLNLGDVPNLPDKRMSLRVNNLDNSDSVTWIAGADGKLGLDVTKDCIRTVGRDDVEEIHGDRAEIMHKNHMLDVTQTRESTIGEDEKLWVLGSRNTTVGLDEVKAISGDMDLQIGGNLTVGAAKISLSAYSTDASGECKVVCGKLNFSKPKD